MNLKEDFSSKSIALQPDYEGEVKATLISSNRNTGNRKSVLYVHGYIDYFFHPHVAEKFNDHNFDFYALDLRKYGRSLMVHQHPNYCKDIHEYYEEISIAIKEIKAESSEIYLLGHSTGGLITSNYMNDGSEKNAISGLILNSPFLDFNQTKIEKKVGSFLSKILSKISVYMKISGVLSPAYPESLHKDYEGEWNFNLIWKPIKGFPTYFKWVVAIENAHRSLDKSNITVPILVMHSSGSKKISNFEPEVMNNDIVLNVDDMKRIGPKLGNQVNFVKVDKGMHDLFLSKREVRENAFQQMFTWLETTNFGKNG